MKIRYADKNDRKAIWTWIQDPLIMFFTKDCLIPTYENYCKWFDLEIKKGNFLIGVKDNLRVGFLLISQKNNEYIGQPFLKPKYSGSMGLIFIQESCNFLLKEKNLPIRINYFSQLNCK